MSAPYYSFGDFELDCARFELRRHGRALKLERIPLELLILLVERDGQVVSRQEIVERLWGKDVFVDTEHGINTAVRKVRAALREGVERPRFIQTVSGKGYRFVPETKAGQADLAKPEPESVVVASPPSSLPALTHSKKVWQFAVVAGIGALLLVTVAFSLDVAGVRDRMFASHRIAPIHSIAILPLANLSGDSSQDYFADGMTDELITALAQNRSLRVVSRTSAMQYKGVNRPLREIAQALGVDGILEGSVDRSTNHVHVNLQLIYAPTDTHVWAQSYDRDLNDAISLPEEVSQTIAAKAKTPPPVAKTQRYISPAAHDAYLQGRFFWFMGDDKRSRQYLEQAAQLQPDYAAAWDGLADIYGGSAVGWKMPPSEGFPKAEEYARKALALDDSLPEVHNTLAAIYLFRDWDWPKAEAESRRAIALNPNFAEAYHIFSYALFVQNRDAQALAEQKISTELDPLSRPWALGLAYLFAGQPDAAIDDLKQRARFRRDFMTQFNMATAYRIKGDNSDAAEAMEAAYLNVNDAKSAAAIKLAFQKRGMNGVWLWSLRRQQELAKKQYVSPWVLAYQYAELRDKEQTLKELGDAYNERSPWLVFLQKESLFDFLHNEAGYQTLVKKIGLAPSYSVAR